MKSTFILIIIIYIILLSGLIIYLIDYYRGIEIESEIALYNYLKYNIMLYIYK